MWKVDVIDLARPEKFLIVLAASKVGQEELWFSQLSAANHEEQKHERIDFNAGVKVLRNETLLKVRDENVFALLNVTGIAANRILPDTAEERRVPS